MNFAKDQKLIKACELCRKEFTLTRIRHRCKRCFRVICADCGKAKAKIMAYDVEKSHTICPICEKEHRFQTEFIAMNQSSWGKLSNAGKKWLQTCQPKRSTAGSSTETYAYYLGLAKRLNQNFADFPEIEKDVMEGRSKRTAFNFSMQEFLYHNQKGLDEQKIMEMATNVLKAYCMKFPGLGYAQGMNYITVFLLSLMDEESAFWMLGYIVSKILPNNFYASAKQGVPMMGYQQEQYIIWELTKEIWEMDENTIESMQTFLEINGPALLVPLLVNYLSFEILYETWNHMLMTRSFMVFRKVVIKLIQVLIPVIQTKGLINPLEAQVLLTKTFSKEDFKEAQKIELNETKIKELGRKFKEEYSSQWMSTQNHIYHTLQKLTHFSKNEIKELQEGFNKYVKPVPVSEVSTGEESSSNGITKEDFKKIIGEVSAKDEVKLGFLKTFDLDQLFKVFDVDHSGMIDFKEFLISLSMLMRGSLEERAELAFHVFDIGSKGTLTAEEFQGYLDSIVQAAMISNRGTLSPFFKDDLKRFEDNMMVIIKEKEQISFMDIKNDPLLHELIKYCDMEDPDSEIVRIRGGTIERITSTLSEKQHEFKRLDTNDQIFEQAPELEEEMEASQVSQFVNDNEGDTDMQSSTFSIKKSPDEIAEIYKEDQINSEIAPQIEEEVLINKPEPVELEISDQETENIEVKKRESLLQSELKTSVSSKISINNEFLLLYNQTADDKVLTENRKKNLMKEAERSNEACQVCSLF